MTFQIFVAYEGDLVRAIVVTVTSGNTKVHPPLANSMDYNYFWNDDDVSVIIVM